MRFTEGVLPSPSHVSFLADPRYAPLLFLFSHEMTVALSVLSEKTFQLELTASKCMYLLAEPRDVSLGFSRFICCLNH